MWLGTQEPHVLLPHLPGLRKPPSDPEHGTGSTEATPSSRGCSPGHLSQAPGRGSVWTPRIQSWWPGWRVAGAGGLTLQLQPEADSERKVPQAEPGGRAGRRTRPRQELSWKTAAPSMAFLAGEQPHGEGGGGSPLCPPQPQTQRSCPMVLDTRAPGLVWPHTGAEQQPTPPHRASGRARHFTPILRLLAFLPVMGLVAV